MVLYSGIFNLGYFINLPNYLNFLKPISYILILSSLIATIIYMIYSIEFTKKLSNEINIDKIYNKNRPLQEILEIEQISAIRYYEYYQIASDGAKIALLLIIALCCIYFVNILSKMENKI